MGAQAPPICKHNARMMGFNQNFRPEAFRQPCTASKSGGGWGLAQPQPSPRHARSFGDSSSSHILNTPRLLDESGSSFILNMLPHLTNPVPQKTTTCLLIWRLLFIIYLTHAPSFGNSGSSYILNTPPPLAIPAQPIS